MARNKNLKIQMHEAIDSKVRIGHSRHQEKASSEERQSAYIHSFNTADSYRQTINEFSAWLKDNKTDVWEAKNLESIDKSTAYEYLKSRENRGLSAWTISKDMSALNKVLDLQLNKAEGCLCERHLSDIQRSRNECSHDKEYNASNYKEQILFSQAFGLRRESVCDGAYAVKYVSLFRSLEDDKIYCRLVEKGGRYREAPCLDSKVDEIASRYQIPYDNPGMSRDEFKSLYERSEELIFDSYTQKIDNHSFRREYAQTLYNELREAKSDELKADYRGYDSSLIKEVSEALGHSRLDVVVNHYLR